MIDNKDLGTRIALELFATPFATITGGFGLSCMLLSVILGPGVGFVGFCSCLLGAASVFWNYTFNMEKIQKKISNEFLSKAIQKRELRLNALDRKLVKNRDSRDQTALRDLRVIYDEFQKDIKEGRINSSVTLQMLSQVDDIFDTCVNELEQSYNIWRTSKSKISDGLRQQLDEQREEIISVVQDSVSNMANVISEIRSIHQQSDVQELKNLGQKLSRQLQIAKNVEERISSIGSNNLDRFDKYRNVE